MKSKVVLLFSAIVALFAIATTAPADTKTWTTTTALSTNGQFEISEDLPVSGYLDKIEVIQSETLASTTTVSFASYLNDTLVDTYYSASVDQSTVYDVARPRIIGTTTAGVNIAAVLQLSPTNTASTQLFAGYERPMIGGNARVRVALTTPGTVTNEVTVRVYYSPTNQ